LLTSLSFLFVIVIVIMPTIQVHLL